jgi:hypothetical protein
MKKHLLIAFLSLIFCSASAQELSAGKFTATISDVKTRSYTQDVFGEIRKITEYIGNCTIEKKGGQTESHTFKTMQIGNDIMTLHINDDDRSGNALTYDLDTKKFEIGGDEYKAKNTKDIDHIILSGILIYAEWVDNN